MMSSSPSGSSLVAQPTGYSPPAGLSHLANGHSPVATTRILELSNFSQDLKTRDIQGIFADWEDDRGGFKIKWVDDTTCLIVFGDAGVAKRAFVNTLAHFPPHLAYPGDPAQSPAKLRAYAGPDVSSILTSVQNRPRSRSNASHAANPSLSHSRTNSNASVAGGGLGRRSSVGMRRPMNGNAKAVQELIDDITSAPPPNKAPNGHGRTASSASDVHESPSAGNGLLGLTIEEVPEVATPRAEHAPTF